LIFTYPDKTVPLAGCKVKGSVVIVGHQFNIILEPYLVCYLNKTHFYYELASE